MHVFFFSFLDVRDEKKKTKYIFELFSFKATVLTIFSSKNERKTTMTLCDFEFKTTFNTLNTNDLNQIQWQKCN